MKEKFIEFLKKEGVYERVKAYALADGQTFDKVVSEHGPTSWILLMFNWEDTDEGRLFWVEMDRKWRDYIGCAEKVQADTANEFDELLKKTIESLKNHDFEKATEEFWCACKDLTKELKKTLSEEPSPVNKTEPTLSNLLKAMEEIGINGDTLFDKIGSNTYEYSDDKMRILFIRK